jgi:hypothetical protein
MPIADRAKIDQYSFVETYYKDLPQAVIVDWVPPEHRRRLKAYMILMAHYYNALSKIKNLKMPLKEMGNSAFVCKTLNDAATGELTIIIDDKSNDKSSANLKESLEQWRRDELFDIKRQENELNGSILGDLLYGLAWNFTLNRPVLKKYDPDIFFPESGEKVHLAWEEFIDAEEKEKQIYKRTYELRKGAGGIRCFVTSGFYESNPEKGLNDLKLKAFEKDVDANGKEAEINNRELPIDFIPLVWINNIRVGNIDFGISDIAHVLPLFDELNSVNTDLAENSRILGGVILANKSGQVRFPLGNEKDSSGRNRVKIEPGTIIDGDVAPVDTSNMNKALLEYEDRLNKRVMRNSGLGPVLGRSEDQNTQESGYALSLQMLGITKLVAEKIRIREPKYVMLFDFVRRMYLAYSTEKSQWSGDKNILVHIKNGLPEDQMGRIGEYNAVKNDLSVRTRLKWLQSIGIPIENIEEEEKLLEEEKMKEQEAFMGRLNKEMNA